MKVLLIWLMLAGVAMAGTINSQPTIPGPLRATDATAVGRAGVPSAYKMTVGQLAGYQCWSSAAGKQCAQAMDTMNLVGGSVGLVGGKPTVTAGNGAFAVPAGASGADIQAALDKAGSMTSVPSWWWDDQTHNTSQGSVVLASHVTYTISAPLVVPPGVVFDLNGSTIHQSNATADAIQLPWENYGYGYGNYFSGVKNGFITGVGAGVSTGRGLFLYIVNNGDFSNLKIKGFKFGVTQHEVQYTSFANIETKYNEVGWYITARPTNTNLTSIDNYYTNSVSKYNTKYGLWIQCQSAATFDRPDVGRNGIVDVLIGSQLVGYIANYAVTSGGTGYAASTTIPAIITDTTGTMAQAYAVTNSSGVVTAVYSVDAGAGYSASPTVSIPGGGSPAVVVAVVSDDTGLGDWDGYSGKVRGKNVFNNLKVEHGPDRPSSGYAIIVNDLNQRQNVFNNLTVQRQDGGQTPYYRWLRSSGFGTIANDPADTSNYPSARSNPAVPGDLSVFRTTNYQCLAVRWPTFIDSPNIPLYIIDETGATTVDGKFAYTGFTFDGFALSSGYALSTTTGSATAPKAALVAKNITLSTSGTPDQSSPSVVLGSRAYYGGQDNENLWAITNKSLSAGSRADLVFSYKNGIGSWTQHPMVLSGDGTATMATATGINTTSQGFVSQSTTPATTLGSGFSPTTLMVGAGWATGSGTSQRMTAGMSVRPEQGVTSPVGVLNFSYGTNTTSTNPSNEWMRFEWGDRLGMTINRNKLTGFKYRIYGHQITGGDAPVLSACGTSPSVATGSTDTAGTFTVGATGTGCVVTFAVAYGNTPVCNVSARTTSNLASYSPAPSTLTIMGVPGTYDYQCTAINE